MIVKGLTLVGKIEGSPLIWCCCISLLKLVIAKAFFRVIE